MEQAVHLLSCILNLGGSALHEAVEARQHGAVTVLIKAAQYEAKRRGDDAKQAVS